MMGHHAATYIVIVFNRIACLYKSAGQCFFLAYLMVNLAVQNKRLLVSLTLIM